MNLFDEPEYPKPTGFRNVAVEAPVEEPAVPMRMTVDEQVWLSAWNSATLRPDSVEPNCAGWWADHCLDEFHARFRK
jgi:hypothetical protein